MPNLPFMKLYVTDYFQDVRPLSLAARGAWMDLICIMWRSENRGQVTYSIEEYSRLFGAPIEQTKQVINELVALRICDASVTREKKISLICRRIVRESDKRSKHAQRQAKYRVKLSGSEALSISDANVTGHSDAKVTGYIQKLEAEAREESTNVLSCESVKTDSEQAGKNPPQKISENQPAENALSEFPFPEAITLSGIPESEPTPHSAAPPPAKKTAPPGGVPNPLWDAAVRETYGGINPTSDEGKKRIGALVRFLKQAGATPEEVASRSRRYRSRWPATELSPEALRKWWDRFSTEESAVPPQNGNGNKSAGQVESFEQRRLRIKAENDEYSRREEAHQLELRAEFEAQKAADKKAAERGGGWKRF